jgi:hypothetical protein
MDVIIRHEAIPDMQRHLLSWQYSYIISKMMERAKKSLILTPIMAMPAARAVRLYYTGINHRPVFTSIPIAGVGILYMLFSLFNKVVRQDFQNRLTNGKNQTLINKQSDDQSITALLTITQKQHSLINSGYNHYGYDHGLHRYYIRCDLCHGGFRGRIHRALHNLMIPILLLWILIMQMQEISFSW